MGVVGRAKTQSGGVKSQEQSPASSQQYAKCPDCHGVLMVPSERLSDQQTRVRCGLCLAIFDAQQHLCPAPEKPAKPLSEHADSTHVLSAAASSVASPFQSEVEQRPNVPPQAAEAPSAASEEAAFDALYDPLLSGSSDAAPTTERVKSSAAPNLKEGISATLSALRQQFSRKAKQTGQTRGNAEETPREHRSWRSRLFVGGALCLIALVVVNTLYINRDHLSQKPSLRPLLAGMCAVTGCQLPPQRALSQIQLVRRHTIYSHPRYKDALVISFAFANRAAFAQPYPVLRIRMANSSGETVAARSFGPEHYLSNYFPDLELKPNEVVEVKLEVQDPGEAAKTFDLAFL